MVTTLPYEITQYLEQKFGKEETKEFVKFFDKISENFEEKAVELAVQKKLELKDELTKELANKNDISLVKAEIGLVKAEITLVKAEIANVESKLDLKIEQVRNELKLYLKFLIILMIIFIGFLNPVVTKLISNWLKLGL
ncbi:MAG: hypothetical protein HW421_3289 [Ignavibacteria bacterium]|nr:hypothetical protein [Ignavibacteria bacterium]